MSIRDDILKSTTTPKDVEVDFDGKKLIIKGYSIRANLEIESLLESVRAKYKSIRPNKIYQFFGVCAMIKLLYTKEGKRVHVDEDIFVYLEKGIIQDDSYLAPLLLKVMKVCTASISTTQTEKDIKK